MVFREHGVMLYLSKDLYNGFIKLQADKTLGRSYAGLLPFTEGLFKLGYITEEVYKRHVQKYSKPLEALIPLTKEEIQEKQQLKKMDSFFKNVLDQWDEHEDFAWRQKIFASAEKYKVKLESAKQVLRKKGVK